MMKCAVAVLYLPSIAECMESCDVASVVKICLRTAEHKQLRRRQSVLCAGALTEKAQ